MKRFLILSIFCFGSLAAIAQTQEEDPFDYGQEFLFAVTKSTNSGLIAGGMFRYASKIGDRNYRTYALEIANIRHPQEQRYRNPYNGASFIWGKQNYLFSIRPQIGLDRTLFRKASQRGVQINGAIAGGPAFGLIVPYYLDVVAGNYQAPQSQPYNTNIQFNEIAGSSSFFKGLSHASVTVGLQARASLMFEFSSFKSSISGFEVGFVVDAYPNTVVLVPTSDNRSVYPAAFLSIVFGNRK